MAYGPARFIRVPAKSSLLCDVARIVYTTRMNWPRSHPRFPGALRCILAFVFAGLFSGCGKSEKEDIHAQVTNEAEKAAVQAGTFEQAFVAVYYAGTCVPGLGISNPQYAEGAVSVPPEEKLIVARLPSAKLDNQVYLYFGNGSAEPVQREQGKVVGVDATGELAFIAATANYPTVPLPSAGGPGSDPCHIFTCRLERHEPKDQAAREKDEQEIEDNRTSEAVAKLEKEVQRYYALAEDVRRRTGDRPTRGGPYGPGNQPGTSYPLPRNVRPNAPFPHSHLSNMDSARLESLERELAGNRRVRQKPPLYARVHVSREDASPDFIAAVQSGKGGFVPEKIVLAATSGGAFAAFADGKKDRRMYRPLAGLRIGVPGISDAGLQVESSEQGFKLIVKLKVLRAPEWDSVSQSVMPAANWTGNVATGQGEQVSILEQNNGAARTPGNGVSLDPAKDSTGVITVDDYMPYTQGKSKERFVGQHVIHLKSGEKLYYQPFLFTVDRESNLGVQVEPHPYLHLLKHAEPEDRPAGVLSKPVVLETEGAVTNVVPTGDGTRLVVTQDVRPFIKFIDLKLKQWTQPIDIADDEPIVAAVSGNKLYALRPKTGVIERWNLSNGEREKAAILEGSQQVLQAAAPALNENGLILIGTKSSLRFLDPATLKPVFNILPTRGDELKESGQPILLSASGDGYGYGYMFETEMARSKRNEGITYTPSDRGPALRIGNDLSFFGATANSDLSSMSFTRAPLLTDPLSDWAVRWAEEKTLNKELFPPPPPSLELFRQAKKGGAVLARFDTLMELSDGMSINLPGLPKLAKRLLLLMEQRMLITVGKDGRNVYLRDLNLNLLAGNGGGILLRLPSAYVERGGELRHQFVNLANSPSTYRLKESPAGAELTESGELRWKPPLNFPSHLANFTITVEANGEAQTYEFPVRLIGPVPLFVRLSKGETWGGSLAVPGKEVPLSGGLVHTCLAGSGKSLVCQLEEPNQLVVVDLETARITAHMALSEKDIGFTANAEHVFLCVGGRQTIEVRKLSDLTWIKSYTFPRHIRAISIGYGVSSPLFMADAPSDGFYGMAELHLLNPETMEKTTPLQVSPDEMHDVRSKFSGPRFTHLESSNDGKQFIVRADPEGIIRMDKGVIRYEEGKRLALPGKELMDRFDRGHHYQDPSKMLRYHFRAWLTSSLQLTANLFLNSGDYGKIIVFPPNEREIALSLQPIPKDNSGLVKMPLIFDEVEKLVLPNSGRLMIYPWRPREWFTQIQ